MAKQKSKFLKEYGKELKEWFKWLGFSVLNLALAILFVFFGFILMRIGRRWVIIVGIAIFIVGWEIFKRSVHLINKTYSKLKRSS